jgi:3-oxoacyl-[acyl-carrier-protein] synthase II
MLRANTTMKKPGGCFMEHQPRVVVTGLGAIAPNGIGKEAFWNALVNGRSGIDHITRFDASRYPCQIAGEVRNFQPTAYMDTCIAKRIPWVSKMAIAAGRMALDDSSLQITAENASKIGVCFGTSTGKAEAIDTEHLPFLDKGVRGIHPSSLLEISPHAVSTHVALALGVKGICGTMSTGCTLGLDAIQWGYHQISFGRAAVMLLGGAEALLTPFTFGMACSAGLLSKRNEAPQAASRPFETHRDGIVLSEGSGALVLEKLEHAQERHATIYAEILGYANGREGQDLFRHDPSGVGMAHVMETALYQSSLPKSCIDYISAHGSSLRDVDAAETNAIKAVFGHQAYSIPVSSIKSMIGQPFAAASALQAVASCLTLKHNIIPPTINYDTPDPCCDLDYVPNHARRARVRVLLAHAHGMGWANSALVLGRVEP